MGEGSADLGGECRGAAQFADVFQYHRAADARAVADDLAVAFDDQHLPADVFFLARHQVIEEAQGHVDGGDAIRRAVSLDRHGAVGARFLAGVVLVGSGPGTLTARCGKAAFVPALVVVVGGGVTVPEGVHCQFARRIAVPERAVLVASGGALVRQRPDPSAEYFQLAVLIHQARQHLVDRIAVEQGDGLGDAALLGLNLIQLALDLFGHFGDAVEHHLFFGIPQRGRDQLADAHHRQHK